MRIAFLGFGLIAGSIARALRSRAVDSGRDTEELTLAAWSPSGNGPRVARDERVIDQACATAESAVAGADLVVLGGPPLACLELIDRLGALAGGVLAEAATVTDVASTKRAIVARANERSLRFVGGHPMAGRENTGYEAGAADLFVGRPWVVVPGERARAADVERVEWLARSCRAVSVSMNATEHDVTTAAISHAPLVLATALATAVAGAAPKQLGVPWPDARGLGASGWRDMTRLARGDAAMGAGIAATNADDIARVLRLVQAELDGWLVELEADGTAGAPDYARLLERFERARRALE